MSEGHHMQLRLKSSLLTQEHSSITNFWIASVHEDSDLKTSLWTNTWHVTWHLPKAFSTKLLLNHQTQPFYSQNSGVHSNHDHRNWAWSVTREAGVERVVAEELVLLHIHLIDFLTQNYFRARGRDWNRNLFSKQKLTGGNWLEKLL